MVSESIPERRSILRVTSQCTRSAGLQRAQTDLELFHSSTEASSVHERVGYPCGVPGLKHSGIMDHLPVTRKTHLSFYAGFP